MAKVAAFALLLPAGGLAAQTAPQVSWQRVHSDDEGEVFVDPASVRRDGDNRTIRSRTTIAHPEDEIAVIHSLTRFNCAGRTYTLLHITAFNAAGAQIVDADVPDERRQANPEGGADDRRLIDTVCAL